MVEGPNLRWKNRLMVLFDHVPFAFQVAFRQGHVGQRMCL